MNHAASDLMRRTIFAGAVLGVLFFQASCARQAPGPHATILMRDGTTLSGTVTATSPAEVTLTGDDNAAHTVPMTQVKSIEYDDAAAAQAGGGQTGATANRRCFRRRTSPTGSAIPTPGRCSSIRPGQR